MVRPVTQYGSMLYVTLSPAEVLLWSCHGPAVVLSVGFTCQLGLSVILVCLFLGLACQLDIQLPCTGQLFVLVAVTVRLPSVCGAIRI